MSAAQPKPAEPSMEEILASIRRIISDDQAAKPAATAQGAPQPSPMPLAAAPPPAAPKPAPLPMDDEEVMDLAPRPARKPEPHFITDDPVDNDLSFDEPVAAPAVEAPKGQDDIDSLMAAAEFEPSPPPPPPMPLPPLDRLVSPTTDRMVTTAFSSLANTVLSNNARTLDDIVQDMMRPMIKNWLDDNLPNIVERLVRAEIERVARGGR
jgi:uncharacterized protein